MPGYCNHFRNLFWRSRTEKVTKSRLFCILKVGTYSEIDIDDVLQRTAIRKLQTLPCQRTILLLPLRSCRMLPYVEPSTPSALAVIKIQYKKKYVFLTVLLDLIV